MKHIEKQENKKKEKEKKEREKHSSLGAQKDYVDYHDAKVQTIKPKRTFARSKFISTKNEMFQFVFYFQN